MTAPVGVFISYNHKDNKIADALVESITSLSSDLAVFIDHSGLEGGDDYEATISASIQKSQWFVIICSGGSKSEKDMSWCFYEAGQFRAKLEAGDQPKIRDRMCYLYDSDRPSQLARYQGSLVAASDRNENKLNIEIENDDSIAYENTELFDFFQTLLTKSASCPLRNVNDPNVRKLMRNGVRKITLAFIRNGVEDIVDEEVFQPRISFRVPPPPTQPLKGAEGLEPATVIAGEYNALPTIFTIAGTTTTWTDIKTRAATLNPHGMTPLWINDLEAAVSEVMLGGVPRQTDFLCYGNDGKFYRPIIARTEIFRSKARKCYVAFIPSRDRRFNLSFRTSLLMSALILSIRFRQRVLPLLGDIGKAANVPEKKKAELLQKLRTEIVLVEAEAIEFGLEAPKDEHDDPPLLNNFRDGPEKDFMRGEIAKWSATRTMIFEKIAAAQSQDLNWSDAASAVAAGLSGMREVNGVFIDRLCNELLYAEKVNSSLPLGTGAGGVETSADRVAAR